MQKSKYIAKIFLWKAPLEIQNSSILGGGGSSGAAARAQQHKLSLQTFGEPESLFYHEPDPLIRCQKLLTFSQTPPGKGVKQGGSIAGSQLPRNPASVDSQMNLALSVAENVMGGSPSLRSLILGVFLSTISSMSCLSLNISAQAYERQAT